MLCQNYGFCIVLGWYHYRSEGAESNIFGSVLLLLSDTLAAHEIGGFKVGVGFAHRICRDCFATKDEVQSKVS